MFVLWRPGVLQSRGYKELDTAEQLNWLKVFIEIYFI